MKRNKKDENKEIKKTLKQKFDNYNNAKDEEKEELKKDIFSTTMNELPLEADEMSK
jgi:hypothetical protein